METPPPPGGPKVRAPYCQHRVPTLRLGFWPVGLAGVGIPASSTTAWGPDLTRANAGTLPAIGGPGVSSPALVIQSSDSAPGQQCPQLGPAGTKNFSTTRKAGATCSHQPARQTHPQPKGPGVPRAWLWLVRMPTLPTARRSQDPNQAQFVWRDDPASL